MAVAFRAVGTWENGATGLIADEVLSVPAAQLTGDLVIVLGSWKAYTITATVSGYTEVTEFADGTVAAGTGTGSMKVGAWYKEATSDAEADPTLDFSAAPNVGEGTIIVFSKASGETWVAPKFVTAAWPNQISGTVSASSTVDVANSSAILCLIGTRDDSATFTRTTTSISEAAAGITFNGNYAEQPATHASTLTGGDMASDAGYRLVTTGMTAATLQAECTLSVADSGAILWLVLEATTLLTPGLATLTLTAFTPTVIAGTVVTPGVASLALTAFAPTVTVSGAVTSQDSQVITFF